MILIVQSRLCFDAANIIKNKRCCKCKAFTYSMFWGKSKKLSLRQRQQLLVELFFVDSVNLVFSI